MPYRRGDYWMICHRTNRRVYRSDMRREWNGHWVEKDSFEPRHPQDFVRTYPEKINKLPSNPDDVLTMGTTTLSASFSDGAVSITLTSVANLSDGDTVGIKLNNSNATHWSSINGNPVGSTVVLRMPLKGSASSGNTVYLPSVNNERWA